MKLLITTIALLLVPLPVFSQDLSTTDLRELFYQAAASKQAAQRLYDKLLTIDESSQPLLLGYKGMACFMICHHALNPYSKIKYFLQGRSYLDQALKRDPGNLELRFLRFTVQTNAPEFLGYTRNILADKTFILNSLENDADKTIAQELRIKIVEYLLQTKYCTPPERSRVESYLTGEEDS